VVIAGSVFGAAVLAGMIALGVRFIGARDVTSAASSAALTASAMPSASQHPTAPGALAPSASNAPLVPIRPTSVTAIGFIHARAGEGAHPPDDAFDGRLTTAWQVKLVGGAQREWIEARFSRAHVAEVRVTLGVGDSAESKYFLQNARPAKFHLEFDEGPNVEGEAERTQRDVVLRGFNVSTTRMRLVVDKEWPGDSWQDLGITEIEILAAPEATARRQIPDATWSVTVPAGGSGGGAWSPSFAAARFGITTRSYLGAVAECLRRDLVACSEAQWERACDSDRALASAEAWTSITTDGRAIIRGGGACSDRKVTAPSGAALGVVCCERGIAVRTTPPDYDLASEVSAALGALEAAIDHHDSPAVARLIDESGARFFLVKSASPPQIRSLFDEDFQKSPDLWALHDGCHAERVDDSWKAECRKVAQRSGLVGVVTSLYSWAEKTKRLRSIADGPILRKWGPL